MIQHHIPPPSSPIFSRKCLPQLLKLLSYSDYLTADLCDSSVNSKLLRCFAVHVYKCVSVCVRVHVCVCVRVCEHVYPCVCVCVCSCEHTSICVGVGVCV